jgi:hypothetical protein
MPNTLRPIRIRHNIQLLLLSNPRCTIRVLDALRCSLGRGTRRRCLRGGFPLRGAGAELDEVVFLGHAVPLCDPALGERWGRVVWAFLAWSALISLSASLPFFI